MEWCEEDSMAQRLWMLYEEIYTNVELVLRPLVRKNAKAFQNISAIGIQYCHFPVFWFDHPDYASHFHLEKACVRCCETTQLFSGAPWSAATIPKTKLRTQAFMLKLFIYRKKSLVDKIGIKCWCWSHRASWPLTKKKRLEGIAMNVKGLMRHVWPHSPD